LLDFEAAEPEVADPSAFQEIHVIWIFVGLNLLYVISNLYFIRLDKRSNNGNVEHAKLQDVKEGYESIERQTEDSIHMRMLHIWRVRLYIALLAFVLAITWISFGVALGYRRS
jgi:hypothetical protein